MKRMWVPTGVGDPEPGRRDLKLSLDTKEQIKQFILDRGHSNADLDAFFGELDKGLSRFKQYARMRKKGLPATARKNLKKALKASLKLNDRINELDGNSRQLLDEAAEGGLEGFRSRLSSTILELNEALKLSFEYPQGGGRLLEPHRIYLAADVADAIEKFIHVSPSSTRAGIFYAILESVCTEAFGKDGKDPPDVYELARKALSYPVKRTTTNGMVEYLPPATKD